MHIAFFDSGLGGLSVAQELFSHPQVASLSISQLSYIADTEAYPYGNKLDAWLNERILKVVLESHQRLLPDMWVIACNTASTLVLDALRAKIHVPIIGVVPAIKPAAAASKSKVIGVLATPATVARNYTAQLITNHAPGCQVLLHGSDTLVHESEKQLLGGDINLAVLQKNIDALMNKPNGEAIDAIVLGCTHYPLIKAELGSLAPDVAYWVDSGEAIARRVISLANEESFKSDRNIHEKTWPKADALSAPLAINWCVTGKQTGQKILAASPMLTDWLLKNYLSGGKQEHGINLCTKVFELGL